MFLKLLLLCNKNITYISPGKEITIVKNFNRQQIKMLEMLSKQNGFPIIQYIIFIHCLWIIYFRVVKECLIYFFRIFVGDMIVLE